VRPNAIVRGEQKTLTSNLLAGLTIAPLVEDEVPHSKEEHPNFSI
jgi:hypothetical protein